MSEECRTAGGRRFNLLGQIACTAGIDFTLATFLCTIITLGTGTATDPNAWVATQGQVCECGMRGPVCVRGRLCVRMCAGVGKWLGGVGECKHRSPCLPACPYSPSRQHPPP